MLIIRNLFEKYSIFVYTFFEHYSIRTRFGLENHYSHTLINSDDDDVPHISAHCRRVSWCGLHCQGSLSCGTQQGRPMIADVQVDRR